MPMGPPTISNNRAENSHQPTRRRERIMKRFKSAPAGGLHYKHFKRQPAPVYLWAAHREHSHGALPDWAVELVPVPAAPIARHLQ